MTETTGRGGAQPRPVAVLGMGNVLLGDDGIGPYVAALLRARFHLPETVACEDIGTPGLDLIPHLSGRRVVILVDALGTGGDPGTVRTYEREEIASSLVTNRLSPHDPGLAEALATLELAGDAPERLYVVGVVPAACETGMGLSPELRAAAPDALREVVRLLASEGVELEPREAPLPLDAWWAPGDAS